MGVCKPQNERTPGLRPVRMRPSSSLKPYNPGTQFSPCRRALNGLEPTRRPPLQRRRHTAHECHYLVDELHLSQDILSLVRRQNTVPMRAPESTPAAAGRGRR